MRRPSSCAEIVWPTAVCWCLLLVAFSVFAAEEDRTGLSARRVAANEAIAVEVAQRVPCCPSRLVVSATPAGGTPYSFEIEGRVEELTGLRLAAAGKLIVEGHLRYGGDVVLVIDLSTKLVEQSIWAYGYALSPDATRLIYQTHYPRMAPPDGRRSIVLLYDLREGPGWNRFGDLPRDWPSWNAGRPVFPRKNACSASSDIMLDGDFVVSSPFLWSPDGRRVVFLAGERRSGESDLVVLDLTREPCDGLSAKELDLEALLQRPDWDGPLRFASETLEWESEKGKEVVVKPGPPFASRVVLPLP